MSIATRRGGGRLLRKLFTGHDHPPLAAGLMVMALALLSLQDAIIKLTSSDVSIWQFQFMRSGFNLALLFGGVMLFGGLRTLPPKRVWAVGLRSLFLVGAMLCFFSGVPFLSLAEIAAGLYLFPLIVTLLSRFVLGEHVDGARLAAVGAGFCGSLLILKPGAADFQAVSLLPISAAFFYACMILTTRRLCRQESPLTLATGVAMAFLSIGLFGLLLLPPPEAAGSLGAEWPYLLTGWHELSVWTVLAVMACSGLNLVANISLARAYQTAESSWLAPYDYSYLVFAAAWGYAIWGTVPDALTVAGMVLIAAAGIFVATRGKRDTATSA
ncbi:MAG: DMT family transporter [Alphaproteobacteria bacterium]|nr:DMT family transporter [Alphaproteobacteria bacterium]